MKKIIVAIDSFKGCLTSAEAGAAAADGVRAACPDCDVVVMPIADGGEGMIDVLTKAAGASPTTVRAHDPLMNLRDARYAMTADGQTAFIEMAAISGLPLVPAAERNPLYTTTYGTGELIRDALERGCRRFVIGLGGSATNDAGLGMLQALGFRFYNKKGDELGGTERSTVMCGCRMHEVAKIDTSSAHPLLKEARFTAACDVRNPLTGPDGAACVFAPQKGAGPAAVAALDDGLKQLATVIKQTTGTDVSALAGAGAAGGLGGGLAAFLHAALKPGIQILLDALHFDERIEGADLIFTGEGKADRQSLMGKVPSGILEVARRQCIPVVLVAGSVEDEDDLMRAGFHTVSSINPYPVTLQQAMEYNFARKNLKQTVEQICRKLL